MELSWLRPIVSGAVGALAVYLLMRSGRKPAPSDGNRRVLTFSIAFKVMAVALIPISFGILYAAANAPTEQLLAAIALAVLFPGSTGVLVYQAFFVYFAYDDDNIYYRSPLAGRHVIPWEEVEELAYSRLMQAHYLRTTSLRRIWCSEMLLGYAELVDYIEAKFEAPRGANAA